MTLSTLDAKYAEALIDATGEVFSTMVQMPATGNRQVPDADSAIREEVVAVLGFTGSQEGVFILSSSLAFARKAAAAMLMAEESEMEDPAAVADSFGELCNMVGGSFKNTWVADGHRMDLSVPSVALGSVISLMTGHEVKIRHAVLIDFEGGSLRIDLRFHH